MALEILSVRFGTPDFEACFAIRWQVFVREQNVPADEERDEHDSTARHFLARVDGVPLGTARLILKDGGTTAKIGRVAVLAAARGHSMRRSAIRLMARNFWMPGFRTGGCGRFWFKKLQF
jgi:predicted GNAT family N-acyltransferase